MELQGEKSRARRRRTSSTWARFDASRGRRGIDLLLGNHSQPGLSGDERMTLVVEKEALPLSRCVCNALDVTFDLKIRLESVIKVDENFKFVCVPLQ